MEEMRIVIRKKYTMDRELSAWRWEVQQLKEDLAQKNWALREAKVALAEYEGGIQSFFHKLSGKFADKQEALSKQVRIAQAAQDYCESQLASAKAALQDLEEAAAKLPTREELFVQYPDSDYLKQQDTLLCADRAIRLLRKNERFLLEARDWAENRNADFNPLGIQYDKTVSLNKAADCAREIWLLMEQIRSCGFGLDTHSYFRNPDGFIAGVARQYGQLDQINFALRAVRETLGILQELQQQLAD